ncbi:hypothetical protein BB559_007421 [Furculomyces boomerangus]|uniref:NADP-dependent oxidoreductase domain-containing protein n=2 Tax=Harpellales TaxID=61421 RepID=A0A2T9XXG1_9FUNG|nr:hypothetical protein BB559_007421 [Furculomyces boomerangus]PVZ97745.1 hypothetical protein BB558_006298 [Smittium angustum]
MTAIKKVLLNNGLRIPIVGLGTSQMVDREQTKAHIKDAIRVGYRHIDTAVMYNNEEIVGEALEEVFNDPSFGVARKDIWITSKILPMDQGYEGALNSVASSLKRLRTDYIDMYLIHWPFTGGLEYNDEANKVNRKGSWKALEELYEQKKLRAIGVSNFYKKHIDELLTYAKYVPVINQCEYHPLLPIQDEVDHCKKHGIVFEAYMSLARGRFFNGTVEADEIGQVAEKHGATKAQVLLSWAINRDVVVIPKASSISRLKENFESQNVELDQEDMDKIDSISKTTVLRICPDPNTMI